MPTFLIDCRTGFLLCSPFQERIEQSGGPLTCTALYTIAFLLEAGRLTGFDGPATGAAPLTGFAASAAAAEVATDGPAVPFVALIGGRPPEAFLTEPSEGWAVALENPAETGGSIDEAPEPLPAAPDPGAGGGPMVVCNCGIDM